MKFNEDSRVKIPAILHLTRLGYNYLPLEGQVWDMETNIFVEIFKKSIQRINPDCDETAANKLVTDLSLLLDNEDLGKEFYERLIDQTGIRLIDFENFGANSLHVVTELTCKKDDEEFRPDITLLINGMPLVFIEVKKPNNREGVLAEYKRMQKRFRNKKFKKFINITQLMVFSNNMEYDDGSPEPIEGAYYATTSYQKAIFNYFREEEEFDLGSLLQPVDSTVEILILKDNNLLGIKGAVEYQTNKKPETPTHKILTSLFQKDRLSFLLRYAFAYVKEKSGLQKHIMRYPQLFATKAIERSLDEGIKKGIIWHTQGSGKTALTFYNVKHLKDYFSKQGVIPKFYFIVDRLDLLNQASKEFAKRGLVVHKVNSKEEFAKDIKSASAVHNDSGKSEITVVNIQKFKDDPSVVKQTDYQLNIQRVYFLDEVHRSYNPNGSFLANLKESDPNAIKIGLTGTPLLGQDYNSRSLFGDYIHKYYYNSSILDGYTLRLIREEIETKYKMLLQEALKKIDVLEGELDRKEVYAHPKFVEPMLDYIVQDFERARISWNDNSIGGMVICDSSDQAKKMYKIFQEKYDEQLPSAFSMAAEPQIGYNQKRREQSKVKTASLILHDIGTKEKRDGWVKQFKDGEIDFLFVYNMLLTGFDAKRLKKLYIGRVIKSHNLLQALTRVNRTYKEFKYGYVVDFADIQQEFDRTNKAYFDELQSELGDELEHYSNIFKSEEEIKQEIEEIKDLLFRFDVTNAAIFSRQINEISDRKEMLQITKALNNAKSLYNVIRMQGQYELLERLDFYKLTVLSREANNHLALINTKEALENDLDNTNILNVALEDVLFTFTKVKEEEMVLADQLKNSLQQTREMLGGNFDPKDPAFVSLKEELERLFKKRKLTEVSKEEMEANMAELEKIYKEAKQLERQNQLLKAKYQNDEKYARLHKRLMEKNPLTESERKLFEALNGLKTAIDSRLEENENLLNNEGYTKRMINRLILEQLEDKRGLSLNPANEERITNLVVTEYMNEYYGRTA